MTEIKSNPFRIHSLAAISMTALSVTGLVISDIRTPDEFKNHPIKLPDNFKNVSGAVKERYDPYIGFKGYQEISFKINGKAGDTYRVVIHGNEPSRSDFGFYSNSSDRIFHDSGDIKFTIDGTKEVAFPLTKIPGSPELALKFRNESGKSDFREYIRNLVK